MRGLKSRPYEGGIRPPSIVPWPGKAPADRVGAETGIGGVDFLPVLCRHAGAPPASAQLAVVRPPADETPN